MASPSPSRSGPRGVRAHPAPGRRSRGSGGRATRRPLRQSAETRPAFVDEAKEGGRHARGVVADRVLFEPEVAWSAPFVDYRRGYRADAEILDLRDLRRRRLEVCDATLGVVGAQVVGRRIV